MIPNERNDPGPESRVVRVAVDVTTFNAGGVPGGLKLFIFAFLDWIARNRGSEFAFCYFTRPHLVPEVEAFRRSTDWNVCLGTTEASPPRPGLVAAPDAESTWTERWPADLLYTPWDFSKYHRPEVPSINLITDTLHRDWPEMLPPDEVRRREHWFRRIVTEAGAIQCNSAFVRDRLHSLYAVPAGKLFVIHNAIQDEVVAEAARAPAIPQDRPYFLYPANDWPHKNHPRLLAAYAGYVARVGPDAWDLVLTGHFESAHLCREQISELGITGRCRVLGYLGRQEFAGVFRNAGALVFPSLNEGFGIPILEALALGLPVACSNTASMPEVAGDAALYFDPCRAMDITMALERISGDEGLRRRLAAAGPKRAKLFSIGREAGRLADRFASMAKS